MFLRQRRPPIAAAGFALGVLLVVVATSPAHAQEAIEPSSHADDGRFRSGFDLFAGVGFGGDASGPVYGARIRMGWQFDRLAALYLQGAIAYWDSSSEATTTGATASGAFAFHLTPVFSFTPRDIIEIAAGPSFDHLETSKTESTLLSGSRVGATGVTYDSNYLGVHGRIAGHFGGQPRADTGRRVSFTTTGDIHATLAEGSVLTFFTIGVGVDWY